MRLGPCLVVVLCCWVLGACTAMGEGPALLDVSAVHPSAVELGDRVDVIGNGFPEGHRGTATFDGELFRPGLPVTRARGLVATVTAATRQRLILEVDGELVAAFCGRGAAADHTTFRGTLLVAFSPRQPAAPPVVGRLNDVQLDWHPPAIPDAIRTERTARGQAALDALGLTLETEGAPSMNVLAVLPDGRAASAGLLPGDELLALGGLRLTEVADFAIPAGAKATAVRFRRGNEDDPLERAIDLEGLVPLPPENLSAAGLLLGTVVAVLLLITVPLGRLLTWAERRAVTRFHAAKGQGGRGGGVGRPLLDGVAALAQGLLPTDLPLAWRVLPYLEFLAVTAAFTSLAFDGVIVAAEADLPLGLLGVVTATVCVGLVAGGRLGGPGWSLWAGLRTALRLLGFQLPLVAAFASAVLLTGSTRVRDLVVAQGAVPWSWHAFTSPASALGVVLVLLALTPRPAAVPREVPELDPIGAPRRTSAWRARSLLAAVDAGQVLAVASLVALVLLGGYALPGVAPAVQRASLPLQALGALLLAAKTWALVGIVGGLRWVVPELGHADVTGLFWRVGAPGSLLVVGLAVGFRWGAAHPIVRGLSSGMGVVLSAMALFVVAWLAVRVLRSLARPGLQVTVNPWL